MIELAALGCSTVALVACAAERRRRRLALSSMGAMTSAMLVTTLAPDARGLSAAFGVGLWVLAAVTARLRDGTSEGERIVRAGSTAVMGILFLLHALGDARAPAGSHVHLVTAPLLAGVVVAVLAAALLKITVDPRSRLSLRGGIELWAVMASCGLMLAH